MTKNKNYIISVWNLVKKVPVGNVTTYGQIAKSIGIDPRMVGWALHANKPSLRSSDAKRPAGLKSADVPCHRVVNREGRLAPNFAFSAKGGPSSGGDGWVEQRRRLEAEGVEFKDEMHVDMTKCQVNI